MKGQKDRWNTKWTYIQIQYSVLKYVPYVFSPKYPLLSNSQCHVSIMCLHDQSKRLRAEHNLSLCCMWQILCFMSAGFLCFHSWPPFSSVVLYLAPTLFTDYYFDVKSAESIKCLTPLFKTNHAGWLATATIKYDLSSYSHSLLIRWEKPIFHFSSVRISLVMPF